MKQETVVHTEQVKRERKVGIENGVFMLLIGAIFLMGTSGITFAGHSPTMLIALVPIYWIGVSAYKRYQEDGRLTPRVFSTAVFALLPFTYLVAMFLGYPTSRLWPLGIIVVGISFLLFGARKQS